MRKPDYPDADPSRWAAVDTFFSGLLAPDDPVLSEALRANAAAGLPAHDVTPAQGQFLAVIIRSIRAKRVLEIGTLGAYSTIRMARVLPEGGRIITIESNPAYAAVAQSNIKRANVADKIQLLKGRAIDVLPHLTEPFDFIFIDADKPNNPTYLAHSLRLSRRGTVIIGDNVVRGGAVVEGDSQDANVKGVRTFVQDIAREFRLTATAIQTVGEKGWDGFAIAVVDG